MEIGGPLSKENFLLMKDTFLKISDLERRTVLKKLRIIIYQSEITVSKGNLLRLTGLAWTRVCPNRSTDKHIYHESVISIKRQMLNNGGRSRRDADRTAGGEQVRG